MKHRYRMTKKDAYDLAEVLETVGIQSSVSCEGKSNWSIDFEFDKEHFKPLQKSGRSPVGEKLKAMVKKRGMVKVCEKYGISERTVYRRMQIEP